MLIGWKRRSRSAATTSGAPRLSEGEQAHLALIQGIISRQAGNSFLIKGWVLTVTVALLGFAIGRNSWTLATFAIGPLVIFGWLDAYYFRQERLFRCLYNAAIVPGNKVATFSMDTAAFKGHESTKWKETWQSLPFVVLYVAMLVADILTTILIALSNNPTPKK